MSAGEFMQRGSAYQEIQGKNPQTLGYGLTDSPAGLAGWIVEKFYAWTDHDGDLETAVTRDQILTNLTVYWVTQTINSSVRLYCESHRSGRFGPMGECVKVPTAAAVFPKEMFRIPRAWAEKAFNLRRYTRFDRGGHFAALEEPDLSDRRHPRVLRRGAMSTARSRDQGWHRRRRHRGRGAHGRRRDHRRRRHRSRSRSTAPPGSPRRRRLARHARLRRRAHALRRADHLGPDAHADAAGTASPRS